MAIYEFEHYTLDELYDMLDNAESLEANGIGQDEDMMRELQYEIERKEEEM